MRDGQAFRFLSAVLIQRAVNVDMRGVDCSVRLRACEFGVGCLVTSTDPQTRISNPDGRVQPTGQIR